jgi:hypothetical protein
MTIMDTFTQALYFVGAVVVTAANPFLTLLLILSFIMDRTAISILYNHFVIGFTSFCVISFYASPFIFLIYIAARYLK